MTIARRILRTKLVGLAGIFCLLLLGACAKAPVAFGVSDPFEKSNRATHAMNKSIDKAFLRPLSQGYSNVGDGAIGRGIDNFANNLSLPSSILNDLLQLNVPDAFSNTARFALNSTIGLFGLIDVAGHNGIPAEDTDFGETLHVWGFSEGHYVELPFFGPSTGRDTAGLVVDFLIDPINVYVPRPQRYVGTAAALLKKVHDRGRYGDLVDSMMYESEDSYAQARLFYLQSRRHSLYGGITEEAIDDPYEE